jgi:chemotaxis protein histidine kinase CheA/CheY-like chemotaxis protein
MLTPDRLAEAQLQQELREMFLIDTQQQLETYFDIIQRLKPESWIADIQSIYRAIHTIKGGAVTVEANSTLYGAMALEDLLSDLRYLEVAPPLSDGRLGKILLEAGELLASCLEVADGNSGNYANVDDGDRVQLTLQRLQTLHSQVKAEYLPDWNEMKQVHQEFAEQGFDLVVLDLEMDLANIPDRGTVPPNIIETARATIAQLTQIGTELELAANWTLLLEVGDRLINNPDRQVWQAVWLPYFQVLKACVKNSGEIDPREIESLDELARQARDRVEIPAATPVAPTLASDDLSGESDAELSGFLDNFFMNEEAEVSSVVTEVSSTTFATEIPASDDILINAPIVSAMVADEDLSGLLDDFFVAAEISPVESIASTILADDEVADLDLWGDETLEQSDESLVVEMAADADLPDLLDDFFIDEEIAPLTIAERLADDEVADMDLWSDETIEQSDESFSVEVTGDADLPDLLDNFFDDEPEDSEITDRALDLLPPSAVNVPSFVSSESDEFAELDEFDLLAEMESEIAAESDALATDAPVIEQQATAPSIDPVDVKRGISIPVPLERLDRSAQQVVDTLLTARTVMNASSRLQSQLSQLNALTQDSSRLITGLRQLQDNYALLRNISDDRDSGNNVAVERYRQGYTTIVRLLENMLRMSELGQEIETANYESKDQIEALDRSILRLKDGIETSRLVPFRNLTIRAKAILRDLTNRYGKPAELIVENERVEMDAGIVQQLEPALLHILRNAYDHGLETVEQRLAVGKPDRGIIHISLQRSGNLYRLEIEDDGRGIDGHVIYQLALSKGFAIDRQTPVTQENPLTDSEILATICKPGFSSSSTVSEVSGRGVGMDVVVAQLASIGGKLSLNTAVGHGTKITIEVPAPQLLVPCVLFQVGDRTVAFPTEEVLETALLTSIVAKISADDNVGMCDWTLTTSRGDVPGFDLANYWQFAKRSLPDTAICIRTRQGSEGAEIWSIADDLIGRAELLINPLPSPLIAPAGLLGVSLQSDGRLISILDPIALTARLSTNSSRDNNYGANPLVNRADVATEYAKPSAPTILIVDDAALIRRRFEVSLNTYGFITHTCNDGLEALNWLQTNPLPDLMITDIEMPNMDGFTLIDRARQAQIQMPILVVSSRASEEWGKEARRLGASDYLNKGFSTTEMIQKVNSLLGLLVNA